ncbi:MAG: SHOCT domain-containing protein [Actinomycetota bacterium]
MFGWCCGAGGWAIFAWIVLLAILGVGAALLIRALRERGSGSGEPGSQAEGNTLRILEERYARGDIDQEEFEERLPKRSSRWRSEPSRP